MENLRLLLLLSLAIIMLSCGPHKVKESKSAVSEIEKSAEGKPFFRSYEIGENEARDTSFALPRRILDDPVTFMTTLTDVQMVNRFWTERHNYPEKLLYGDSILSIICKKVATANGNPVYLIDNITDEDNSSYYLKVGKKGDRSYVTYRLRNGVLVEGVYEMSKPYWNLIYEWDKREMSMIGETDEWEKTIVSHTGQQLDICTTGRKSGCITRLRCDSDSVYVDMLKLYLWPFDQY